MRQATLKQVDGPIDERKGDFIDEVEQAYSTIAVTPKEPHSNIVRVYHEDGLIDTIYKVARKYGYTVTQSGTENVEDAWERFVPRDSVWEDLDFDDNVRYTEFTPCKVSDEEPRVGTA